MKLYENICGLFPFGDFEYPEGEFKITIQDTTYEVKCREVFLFRKDYYDFTSELSKIREEILRLDKKTDLLPYHKDHGILVYSDLFNEAFNNILKDNIEKRRAIIGLMKHYYCLKVVREHEINETIKDPMDYINSIHIDKGIIESKKIFFEIVREYHDCTMIFRSPYVNLIDVNYLYLKGVYSFFCFENGEQFTECIPFRFNYYNPKADKLALKIQEIFDTKQDLGIEDLFLAKAKIYMRLENYTMAILHAVIGLDVIVPKFINEYLKSKGVNSEAIQDFNNKFGLSVRVKAILKIILPRSYHKYLKNVGIAIGYRNRIMHEGKTNTYFKSTNVAELVKSCDEFIKIIKAYGKGRKFLL